METAAPRHPLRLTGEPATGLSHGRAALAPDTLGTDAISPTPGARALMTMAVPRGPVPAQGA
jgi:hypothetical protein